VLVDVLLVFVITALSIIWLMSMVILKYLTLWLLLQDCSERPENYSSEWTTSRVWCCTIFLD